MQLLILVILLFASLGHVHSFDCYECENCQIPFNKQANTATCGASVTQCMKLTAKLGTVYTYVLKQCGPCSNETFAYGVTYLNVDCCTGAKCNGTARSVGSSVGILFVLVVALRFRSYE